MLSLRPVRDCLAIKPDVFPYPWLRKVGSAAEYKQARNEALPAPSAWVIRSDDKAEPVGFGVSDVTIVFDVEICLLNGRVSDAICADDVILEYRQAIKNKLLGFSFPNSIKPMQWGGGRIVDHQDDYLYYRDRYLIYAMLENYLPDPVISLNNFQITKTS